MTVHRAVRGAATKVTGDHDSLDSAAMSTKPWTGGEGPAQPGPAGLLDMLRRRNKGRRRPAVDPPGAVLFDMDGLLVDSEPLWTIAEERVAERYGGVFTPELKARMIGKRLDLAIEILIEGLNTPAARNAGHAEVAHQLMAEMVKLLASGAPLQPGAVELLDALADARIPLALVSSSYRELVDAALQKVGASRFAVTVAGDEVKHGKPDPEPYLTAARRLGVVPARCVVLEDAPAGLMSAAAAGCACVYVPTFPGLSDETDGGTDNGAHPGTERPQLPDRAVQRASLREVDLELLGRLSVHPHSTAGHRARG
jgi:HAD superfamily hydrolase (TIGR01509 family)